MPIPMMEETRILSGYFFGRAGMPHAMLTRSIHESSRRTVMDNAGCPAFPTCKLSVSCPTLYTEADIWMKLVV